MDTILDSTPQKQCPKCTRWLPATSQFFYSHPNTKDKLRPNCKKCHIKSTSERNQVPEVKAERKLWDRREYHREYHQRPESKQAQKERDTRRSKTQHRKDYGKEYRQTPKFKEIQVEYWHSDRGKEVSRAKSHRKRALKNEAIGTHTAEEIQQQLERQKHECYYCQKQLENKNGRYVYHVDHIVPLTRGGRNSIDNIVIACQPCNLRKQDRLLHEWAEGGRLL